MTNFYKNAIYNMTDSNTNAISVKSKDAGSNRNFMVPAYSRPLTGMEGGGDPGTAFKARPIKHWRKQLNPRTDSNGNAISGVNGRRAGIVGYMDVPGGSTVLGKTACASPNSCTNSSTILSDNILRPNDDKWCCNTNSDGVINRINVNGYIGENVKYTASTILKPNYYSDRKAYLQSRCLLYEQRLSGTRLNGVNYVVNGIIQTPNGTNRVEQRATENCLSQKCTGTSNPNTAITIYKPNNYQYATQGAVDSSSRITRLKYNTITKGGYQAAATAFGTAGGSANSTYNGSDVSPNFLKNRYNNAPCTFTRKGSKTSACFKAMDMYTPTQDRGVVINFSVPFNGNIKYEATEDGYYTINGGSERISMPLGIDGRIILTNANYITIYNPSIIYLDLNNCGLIAVPDLHLLNNLTLLVLGDNANLTTAAAANFPTNIRQLYLNDCNLSAVPDLSSLNNLTFLNLGGNTNLTTAAAANFPTNIRQLYLGGCNLSAVPDLRSLTTLTILNLGGNTNLTTALAANFPTNITELYIGGCNLSAVPDLHLLNNLIFLDLRDNANLTTAAAANFPTNIRQLYLGLCNLSAVPDLRSLTTLTILNLGGNANLTTAAAANFPTNITYLALNGCNLSAVPDLRSLTTLTILDLGGNAIVQSGGPGSGSFNDFKLNTGTYLQTSYNGNLFLTGQGLTPVGINTYSVWTTYT